MMRLFLLLLAMVGDCKLLFMLSPTPLMFIGFYSCDSLTLLFLPMMRLRGMFLPSQLSWDLSGMLFFLLACCCLAMKLSLSYLSIMFFSSMMLDIWLWGLSVCSIFSVLILSSLKETVSFMFLFRLDTGIEATLSALRRA